MSSPPTAVVTAQGVRDGDRSALAALVERRGAAVLAYCEAVAEPGRGLEAAGEAFARFRREVRAAAEPRALDPEALLLSATRRAAAARAPEPEAPRGLLARRLGTTCPLVPELLAVRADGKLTTADRLRLSRHLERCESCRAAEERFNAAERAYVDAPDEAPPTEMAGGLLAALRAAAPNADERRAPVAPKPAEPVDEEAAPAETAEDDDREPVAAAPEPPANGNGNGARAAAAAGPPTLSWDPADVAAATGATPARGRWRRIATRIAVPTLILAAAVVTALAVAGAFTGGDKQSSGSIQTESVVPTPTVRVLQHPTTTPLPEGTTTTDSSEPPKTTASAVSVAVASAEPAATPAPAAATQPAPASAPAKTPAATPQHSKKPNLDARATGGADAPAHNTGGQPASDDPGAPPQP